MLMSCEHNFVFLCMPKCASTSIEAAVKKYCNVIYSGHPGLKHLNAREFHTEVSPLFKRKFPDCSLESICLFREPLEWIYSWYIYRQRRALSKPQNPYSHNFTGNVTFEQFVNAYLLKENRPGFADLGKQSCFVENNHGEIAVDLIFSMKRLGLVEDYLSQKIGQTIKFNHRNRSPGVPSGATGKLISSLFGLDNHVTVDNSKTLDDATLQRLNQYFKKDILIYQKVNHTGCLDTRTDNFSLT